MGMQKASGLSELDDPASKSGTAGSRQRPHTRSRNRADHPKAGAEVLTRLRLLVLNSHCGTGAKLPSERDIAAQLKVGRPAVREAIKALCMLEVLESRRGAGTFVKSLSGLKQGWPVQWKAEDLKFDLIELLEVRRMLEPPAAALAAARATEGHLQEMRRSLEVQAKGRDDRDIASQEDHRFHDAIIRAAGNRVLYDISRVLEPLLIKSRTITSGAATDFRGMLRMHRLIYDAILRGDPETARRAMVDHLHMVGMDLLAPSRSDIE